MIILISDFDLRGSGYMNIAVSLCNQLATKHQRRVTALGLSYNMSEHHWPFSIIPIHQGDFLKHIPAVLHNFKVLAETGQWYPIEAIIVALDIPVQEKLLQIDRGTIPYIGIFPIESGPLCNSWAASLSLMTERLVISEFGMRMSNEAGAGASYLPVGIDTESWRAPLDSERRAIRKSLGFTEDEFVVLTVADNQERKNLSLAAEMISLSRKKINTKWMLVTRVDSPVGWKLDDLATQFDIMEHFTRFDRGLPFDRLWILYAAADAFLLTSKAEGLCLPILESMACGTPVIATNCTAIPEHIYDDPGWGRLKGGEWHKASGRNKPKGLRGFEIPVEFTNVDPWGNSVRSFPNAEAGAKLLIKVAKSNPEQIKKVIDAGIEYAKSRTWEQAGNILESSIRSAISKAAPATMIPDGAVMPASLPRPVPIISEEDFNE